MTEELTHEGVLRKSGRYPWGSGETPYQRNRDFLGTVADLKKKGLSDVDIVKGLGLDSTTQLRALKSIARNVTLKEDQARAVRLREEGKSNVTIGKLMKRNESSVRALLDPAAQERADILVTTANMLKEN